MRKTINFELEKSLYEHFSNSTNYGKLEENEKIMFMNNYEDIYELILYLREQILKNKIFIKKNKIAIEKIKELYFESNYNIKKICELYDYSPITISNILFSSNKINGLKGRDLENYNYAYNNDIMTICNSNEIKNAEDFEKEVEFFLEKKNFIFKTQRELVDEQIKKYGKPISTPDFLLDKKSSFTYETKKVCWIDVKAYYGTIVPLFFNKMKKQTERYVNMYGYGIIIFKYGYTQHKKFKFEGTGIIDWNMINKN